MIKFYVYDSETTGLMLGYHDLIEISVIRCDDKVQFSRNIKALQPKNASKDALDITGKSISDLYQGDSITTAINDFNKFIASDGLKPENRCLICHNVPFDKKWIEFTWKKFNFDIPFGMYLDTMSMIRAWKKSNNSPGRKVSLDESCNLLGITKTGQAHTAKHDARNTFFLWEKLKQSNVDYINFIKVSNLKQESENDLIGEFDND